MVMETVVRADKAPIDIYWNSSNPIFKTSHVIEVNENSEQKQFDQINIICPSGPGVTEKHIIYSVDRESYESCDISSGSPKIVSICDQPTNFLYFTITFRYFSPSPQQLEFKPGESYYFISTSTQHNLYSRSAGYCSQRNMRLQFRIAEGRKETAPVGLWSRYWTASLPETGSNGLLTRYTQILHQQPSQLPFTSSSASFVHSYAVMLVTLVLICISR